MEVRIEKAKQKYEMAGPVEKLSVGLELADNLIQAGRFHEVEVLLGELSAAAGTPAERAAVMRHRGEALFRQSRFDEAYAVLGESLSLLEGSPSEYELFYIYRGLSWVFIRQGYLERARSFCQGAREVLEQQPDQNDRRVQDAWATWYHSMALVEGGEGHKDEALRYYAKEIEILEKAGERSRMVPVYINMGNIHYGLGKLAKALEMQLEADSLLEEDGDDLLRSIIYNNLGGLYLAMGDAVKSKDYYRQQLDLNRTVDYSLGDAFALAGLGRAYRYLGDIPLAEEHYNQAIETARKLSGKGKEASILAELVELRLEKGDIDGAEEALKRAGEILSETEEEEPTRYAILQAQIWYARATRLRPAESWELLQKARALLEESLGHKPVLTSEEVISGKELEIAGWQLASSVMLSLGEEEKAKEAIGRAMQGIADFSEGFSREQLDFFWKRRDMADVMVLHRKLSSRQG